MVIRIVRMSFMVEHTADFLQLFEQYQDQIRHFDGCCGLQLLQDIGQPNVFFTYSHWISPEALEAYRQSELFRQVWQQTKQYFNERPAAWSLKSLVQLN